MEKQKSVLIVGVGSIGERHLRCFASLDRVRVSFCEINAELRQAIARRYPAANVFQDLETALSERPDIAVICTPAHLHLPMALASAKSGSHLLIEKPLGTGLQGFDALREEVAAQRIVAAVAYIYRTHPALVAMREALRQGQFGQPVQIVATAGQNFPHYRPAYRDTYYKDRSTGGGAVQDALTHVINAAEWLVGPVDRLVADVDHQVLDGVAVEDTAHVLTRHGPVMGCFSLNQHQAPNENTITVICQRGTVRFEYHNCRWQWLTEPGGVWHDEPGVPLERDSLFIRQARAFLDAVEGRQEPLCSLDEGEQTLRVNLAILDSSEKHEWITINPEMKKR